MGRVIFLTGATGFIGTQVAERLLNEPDVELQVLIRATDATDAERRLSRAWWDEPDLRAAIGTRVRPVIGDVRSPRLGMPDETYGELVRRANLVVHAAADLRLDAPVEELRAANVDGVRNVLALTYGIDRDHGLERFVHVSTAYVAGGRSGEIDEGPSSDQLGFLSPYEQSKYEGETLVRAAMRDLPIAIARPGMVVGDSRTGAVKTFNTIYAPLRLYLTGRLRIFPMRPDLRVNIVPVDYVAEAIVRMVLDPASTGSTFHLTAPTDCLPTAREMVDEVRGWAREHLGVRLSKPIFTPVPVALRLRRVRAGVTNGRNPLLDLLPYFQEDRAFLRANTDHLVGQYQLDWRDYVPNLLEYATRYGFLHRTGRTVHEQILHRLDHGDSAITYHDVADGHHRVRRSADLHRDVVAAAEALKHLGVAPGDRVAVIGPNGTRYLTIDLAIGLAGAVAVPIYPTSPPADIREIVSASCARVLFVGSPQLFAEPPLSDDVRVVSFCSHDVPASRASGDVETWEAFLARGVSTDTPAISAPVGPDDVATIRYTSGTTGVPKGVVFDHRAIRWMGEAMASLVPWMARNAPARYVSFLPMNHVVEGILATYGPAFLPASVDVWFVEDLNDVRRLLPMVRPVVFFTLPRMYEKMWDHFRGSAAGRRYLGSSRFLRALARPLVQRGLLRMAGLDRCAQLLVGSAPASEHLLRSFRELGIEVHDAYGLTEAPLVTLNRVGRNRIGTVGEPLPDTDVTIASDGEVLVRGPQVTSGYLGEIEQPFHDGWLSTGDLGQLTVEGALVIEGRKKELIKTSYGKYVRAPRIETLLREIPGVVEAMVVGEGRPFCAALVWVDEAHRDAASRTALNAAVVQTNRALSHPEQVKRWAILTDAPSVATGDLTPNMKLRRPIVLRRFADVIDALYGDSRAPTGVDVGEAQRERVAA